MFAIDPNAASFIKKKTDAVAISLILEPTGGG